MSRRWLNLQKETLKTDSTGSSPVWQKISRYWLLFATATAIILLDQSTKVWVQHHPELPLESYWPYGGIEIIPGFFYLAHIVNEGAAWGMFRGFRYGFVALALVALVGFYFFRRNLLLKKMPCQLAFGFICGGILGNLCDRLRLGFVVDFLDFHLPGYRWPAFNVADSGITVGVALYIILTLFFFPDPDKTTDDPPPESNEVSQIESDS